MYVCAVRRLSLCFRCCVCCVCIVFVRVVLVIVVCVCTFSYVRYVHVYCGSMHSRWVCVSVVHVLRLFFALCLCLVYMCV